MANPSTTFQSQSFGTRLRKIGRIARRLQYPLSETSEPIFDLERYGASSHHSGSTRHSSSTFRKTVHDDSGALTASPCGTRDNSAEAVDIVVVERKAISSQDGLDVDTTLGNEYHTTVNGSDQASMRYGDQWPQQNVFSRTIVPFVKHFFWLSYQDPAKERHYLKESWYLSKRIAIYTSFYYYIAWFLILAFYPRPWKAYDMYSWIGIVGFFVVPILPAILFDVPTRWPWVWRTFLFGTTWSWPFLMAFQLHTCGYYTKTPNCNNKDFVGLFFYLIAMPTMALFALRQSRFLHTVGTLGSLLFIAIVLIPQKRAWVRHFFNFFIFQIFMLYISFAREKSDRKIFTLRDQLKTQYKATQKAQASESRASDSKKRFVNYIFHEVRVPLNTALLAIQNLIGEDVFKECDEEHVELVDVLQSSLGMMEKVLNDVLDFNRMEAGKLLYASGPFDFTKAIRSVLLGMDIAASNKEVNLQCNLDRRIEELGDLIGDEMRLRQVLSNLTSNACKFTNSGGSVVLVTKLIELSSRARQTRSPGPANSSVDLVKAKNEHDQTENTIYDKATIRIEVHDSGIGIRASDVRNERLFSPYVQTEIGKRQGGKGTGLGLALVRNIMQLSGGRLGLQSKPGEGSVFWIEQDFEVANPKAHAVKLVHKNDNIIVEEAAKATPAISEITSASETHLEQAHGPVEEVSLVKEQPAIHGPPSSETQSEGIERPSTMPQATGLPFMADHALNRRPSLTRLHTSEFETSQNGGTETRKMPRPFSPADTTIAVPTESIQVVVDPDDERPLHVLVVDDDLLTRRLMTRMITRLGHTVVSMENGLLALHSLRARYNHSGDQPDLDPYDLVFLDNQMPVLSGVEMVTHARMEGIDTMVCGVTGNAMKEDQDEYLASGADFVLTKPVMEVNVKRMLAIAQERRNRARATNA